MKILLIQPKKGERSLGGEDFSIFEPLALEYIASAVSRDHDVRILDMRLEDDLESALGGFQPDVVGITAYTVHVNVVKQLFKKIKALNPRIFTVVGGHHATVSPEDFMSPCIDFIVLGEGVFPFKELISRLDQQQELDGIPGTACAKNGQFIVKKPDQWHNLDSLPLPNRALTKSYRAHYFGEWMKPLASIRTSKGCPFRCNFCALWKITGGRYLGRKPENIVEELGRIAEDFIFFADDESLVNAGRMKTLARLIKSAGIRKRYFLYGRSDTIIRNPDLIEQWKEIGLERVFVGMEFFRDEDFNYIRKGLRPKDNIEAVKLLHSFDIDIYPTFIIRPEFDRNDFAACRKYCLELDLDFIGFAVLTPLPGTDLYDEVRDKLVTHNYDFFDLFHTLLPTKLPLPEFYHEMASLYNSSRSFSNQIAFLRKYPWADIPSLFRAHFKFTGRLKHLYRDY